MTSIAPDLERRLEETISLDDEPAADGRLDGATGPSEPEDDDRPLNETVVVLAATAASLGAAFLAASLFRGTAPKLISVAGVALGAVLSWLSTRSERGGVLQYLVLPVSAVVGAILVAPAATGGTANLPALVAEALRSGGLLQAPAPFEPGWRFLLVVLFAVLTSTAAGVALSVRRPRLAAALPAPVIVAAALLQPKGRELVPSLVGGALAIAALALAYGADLPTSEEGGARFESRRLLRGGALLLLLVVAVVGISRAGFLFPTPDAQPVVPPRRPPIPPPEPDRELFTASLDAVGPYRVGVLDGYDGTSLLLPPIDPARLVQVTPGEPLAGVPAVPPEAGAPTTVTFQVSDLRGGTLPTAPGAVAATAAKGVQYDPRTNVLRLPSGRPPKDFRYDVTAAPPPSGRDLAAAPLPPTGIAGPFTVVPPPPNEVVTLLASAPPGAFDRIQFLRQALYTGVVAAGAGRPVDVTPARVAAMLQPGAEATPYEITVAEVLLARWAGVPARLGFGFYGGDPVDGGRSFRPRHGAAWLEAYFEGFGWVPLVGTPPKAKPSIGEEQKNENEFVSATQDLALVVYVPIERPDIRLVYERIRRWALIGIPATGAMLLLAASWPIGAKALRRRRRSRWAEANGPRARIWAAYCDLRDNAHDLNVRSPFSSPLEFLDAVMPDEEHEELAWLVTRAVWGDLQRDLTAADAEAGVEMARSVRGRIAAAQTAVNRVAAAFSRASLRQPYSLEVPGLVVGELPPTRRRLVRGGLIAASALILLVPLAIPQRRPDPTELARAIPDDVAPTELLGRTFQREPDLEGRYREPGADSLVTEGQVYTIRRGSVVEGSFQVALLRADIDLAERSVQLQIEGTIQSGAFQTRRLGPVRIRELVRPEQRLAVWFPPTNNVVLLVVLRADVEDAEQLVRALVSRQLRLPDDVIPEGLR